jgi:hypothetical protein
MKGQVVFFGNEGKKREQHFQHPMGSETFLFHHHVPAASGIRVAHAL